ncbi:LysR family transcriptional regulator [Pectinatus frisingensis]|jgi:DNA-binding transcriptional LysR family regulator|uniref:LysR family transcriptional regulator n=1 Tax=Pectinatus frisingensis TaxID=865 RepID=UPI0018C5FE68|nr:LysR family transcriptional regulator [Pectinatus frisingensis]
MESNDLRIFRAVALEGTITRAAQLLGYVQSNITARIQVLEKELGTVLFYRKHGMILSPAGEKLLPYAEQVVRLLDEAQYKFSNINKPDGTLKIGTYHHGSSINLMNIFSEYHKKYPQVELSLFILPSTVLANRIEQFKLDGAFINEAMFDNSSLVEDWVIEQQLVLIAPVYVKNLEEVYKLPFLMNTAGCYNRERLEDYLHTKGVSYIRYMEFNDSNAIISGVEAGLGASFVIKNIVREREKTLRIFSVPDKFSKMRTGFVHSKTVAPSAALEQFIMYIHRHEGR